MWAVRSGRLRQPWAARALPENCRDQSGPVMTCQALMSAGVSSYFNNNKYLEMLKCPPKAGVTGSNPVGRAIIFKWLGQNSSDGIRIQWAVKSTVSPNGREVLSHPPRFGRIRNIPWVARDSRRNICRSCVFTGLQAPVLVVQQPHIASYAKSRSERLS